MGIYGYFLKKCFSHMYQIICTLRILLKFFYKNIWNCKLYISIFVLDITNINV